MHPSPAQSHLRIRTSRSSTSAAHSGSAIKPERDFVLRKQIPVYQQVPRDVEQLGTTIRDATQAIVQARSPEKYVLHRVVRVLRVGHHRSHEARQFAPVGFPKPQERISYHPMRAGDYVIRG